VTVPCATPPAFANLIPPTVIEPGSLTGVSGEISPSSSAAVAVIALKVEPVG
jgi:hypothetical protein